MSTGQNARRALQLLGGLALAVGALAACADPSTEASAAQSTVTSEVTVPTTVNAPAITTMVTVTVTEQAPPVTVLATPTGLAADGTFGDGTYLVGKQIQPGNYQASSPNNGSMCYWEINDSAAGIIQYGTNSGVMYVPDNAFSVRVVNCGTWRPAD